MKSAEGDFNRSAEEIQQLDADYWGDIDNHTSTKDENRLRGADSNEQTKDGRSVQDAQSDYWATGNANEGATSEIKNGNEKSNEASY